MIDRKQRFKADEMNPLTRFQAADQPGRQIGGSGMELAREGYSVLDRAHGNNLRRGVDTARPVYDDAQHSDEGELWIPRGGGVG